MAARQEVTFIISARDRTRAVFRRVGRAIRGLRIGLASFIGGATFGALTRQAVNFATSIEGASARLDIASETLQGLKVQAEDLNIPFETLQAVIQRISRNAGQALGGDTRLIDAFSALGISFDELANLDADDLFFRVADAAADTSRSWRETSALIAKIGDTEAVRLRGLLVQGGDALADGVVALQKARAITPAEDLAAIAQAEQESRRILAEAMMEFNALLRELIPLFRELSPFIRDAAGATRTVLGARGEAGFDLPTGTRAGAEAILALNPGLDAEIKQAIISTSKSSRQTADKITQSGAFR